MEALTDILFLIAGPALIAHLALCLVLQNALSDQQALLAELFAIPNKALGIKSLRLLRARYYWPWTKPTSTPSIQGGTARALLLATRLTGFLVPVAFLSFIAASVVEAVS